MTTVHIRPARIEDVPKLQQIEFRAGSIFRSIGMDAIADDDLPSVEELQPLIDDGAVLVATADDDEPVAYVSVIQFVDFVHIEQVSVDPVFGRRGIGRALIRTVEETAHEGGISRITLTTFRDVVWNAPYYERIGFRIVPDDELGAELRAICERERAIGLHRWPRVVMDRRRCGEIPPL